MKKTILIVALLSLILSACQNSNRDKDLEAIVLLEETLYDQNGMPASMGQAEEAINAFNSFIDAYPEDSLRAVYIKKCAKLCQTIGKFDQSVEMFSIILNDYPQDPDRAIVMFQTAMISNDNLGDTATAGKYYRMFMAEFPDSPHFDGARMGVETLGMTEEEFTEYFLLTKVTSDTVMTE